MRELSKTFLKQQTRTQFFGKTVFTNPVFGRQTLFLGKNLVLAISTLFVKGTCQMGLPILRVLVLHSHNPDGPQVWHRFYLHWALQRSGGKGQIKNQIGDSTEKLRFKWG